MENHHVQWENPLFLWPFSIAMLVYQRVNGLSSMAISGSDWLEVPIPYIRPKFQAYVRGYPQQNMAKNMVQYLHFRILEFPLISCHEENLWFITQFLTRKIAHGSTMPRPWVKWSFSQHGTASVSTKKNGNSINKIGGLTKKNVLVGDTWGVMCKENRLIHSRNVNIRLENHPFLADDPNSSGTWDCQLPAIILGFFVATILEISLAQNPAKNGSSWGMRF